LWHRFIGLPGSIGGALFGNAGCFGLEIQHNFASVKVYNLKLGKIEKWTTEDMDFSYRNTKLKDSDGKYFIISLEFDLSEKKEKYHSDVDNIYFREHKQPK
jgi:UDP-N-acetylmuramate dehydrogenase